MYCLLAQRLKHFFFMDKFPILTIKGIKELVLVDTVAVHISQIKENAIHLNT